MDLSEPGQETQLQNIQTMFRRHFPQGDKINLTLCTEHQFSGQSVFIGLSFKLFYIYLHKVLGWIRYEKPS